MPDADARLEQLVISVRESAKYRWVCEDLVRVVGAREMTRRRSLKEAVKATKNALHQVGGAYQPRPIDYAAELTALRQARAAENAAVWRLACADVMGWHSSTRERLAILDRFYATALAGLGPIRSVLDLACGLNPLAIPWMPLAEGAEYYACDIYADMVGFLNECLALAGAPGEAQVVDVTRACTDRRVDLALLLKSLPCLEQIDGAIGPRLLERLNADHILVSFPTRSLGGRSKGMVENYEARFREMVVGRGWRVRRFEYVSELAFLVSR
jgi:16S rRNA (guanine(1405)-N(7))-methyltransferase